MTDPNGDDDAPPPVLPDPNQQDYQDYYVFASTVWDPPPVPTDADWFGKEERTIRDAHAYASQQQYGTTYH